MIDAIRHPAISILLLCLAAPLAAQEYTGELGIDADDVTLGKPEYSPYINQSYPNRVLWGDTHLHTSYSTDAGMIGNFVGPDDAFRFARGETVRASAGERARLVRPLDFLVVADHEIGWTNQPGTSTRFHGPQRPGNRVDEPAWHR